MELVNTSGLEAAWLVSQIEPPANALTAIVKGTFRLQHGRTAILADEQQPLTGNEFEGDDPGRPLRYAMDFAPFKPRADVLVVGSCHSPDGREVQELPVSVRVGDLSKTILVRGDRFWTGHQHHTDAEPFLSMPLNWERSFGGVKFDRNPLGRGLDLQALADGSLVRPLPNLELPHDQARSQDRVIQPAGFGPIPEMWPQRLKDFGKFNDRYIKERWPSFPHGFKWSYFNVAPEDQQPESFLRGDELIEVENMHRAFPNFAGQLPGLRVRCFLEEQVRAHEEFREISMALDTLWIDMDNETLILVWRGNVPVRSEKLFGIYYLFVMAEPLAETSPEPGKCRLLLWDEIDRRKAEDEELEPEEEEEEVEETAGEEEEDEAAETEEEPVDEEVDEQDAPTLEFDMPPVQVLAPAAGANPSVVGDEPTGTLSEIIDSQELESAADAPDDEDEEPPADEDRLDSTRVAAMIAAHESFDGCDLSELDLTGLDFSDLTLREAILENAVLVGAALSGADLSGAVLAGANLRDAKCGGTLFAGADLTGAWLTKADLTGADLTGADLTGAKMRFAVFHKSTCCECIFVDADLSDASFAEANLEAADLCQSRLHRTDFTAANLSDAAMEQAWGRNLVARGAAIHRIRAAKAVLCEADLSETHGDEAVWESADLYAANFSRARLNEAEFSGAYLAESTFDAATVKEARFNEASLRGARMVRCNLYEASLAKADLTGADLRESSLFGATLMDAKVIDTNFKGANLRRIKNREEIKT